MYLHYTYNIPSKLLVKHFSPSDIEELYIELNCRESKWLLLGTYHFSSQYDQYYFNNLVKLQDIPNNYDQVLLVRDFNAKTSGVPFREKLITFWSTKIFFLFSILFLST